MKIFLDMSDRVLSYHYPTSTKGIPLPNNKTKQNKKRKKEENRIEIKRINIIYYRVGVSYYL